MEGYIHNRKRKWKYRRWESIIAPISRPRITQTDTLDAFKDEHHSHPASRTARRSAPNSNVHTTRASWRRKMPTINRQTLFRVLLHRNTEPTSNNVENHAISTSQPHRIKEGRECRWVSQSGIIAATHLLQVRPASWAQSVRLRQHT
jgi:hypothetical protein